MVVVSGAVRLRGSTSVAVCSQLGCQRHLSPLLPVSRHFYCELACQAARQHHVGLSQAQPNPTRQLSPINQPDRLAVISLISANVEADALVQTFETVAGRSAMVGFCVALIAEAVAPRQDQGLFGGFDNAAASVFAAHGALLIGVTAVLAAMSKRQLGLKLFGAVHNTLLAFSNEQRQCHADEQYGQAIDRVFDRVLASTFTDYQLLDVDDFI